MEDDLEQRQKQSSTTLDPQSVVASVASKRQRPSPPHHRIVLLFDLDCFYAQCERVRLGLDLDVPICLLQWNSVLAVSYPARKYGIERGDSWDDVATKSKGGGGGGMKCWAIHLPVLPLTQGKEQDEDEKEEEGTENDDDQQDKSNNDSCRSTSIAQEFEKVYHLTAEEQKRCQETENGVRRLHSEGKACLERYRLASSRIFGVVLESLTRRVGGKGHKNGTPSFILEKASIDEFYLDISDYCYGSDLDDKNVTATDGRDNVTTKKKTVVIGELKSQETGIQEISDDEPNQDMISRALERGCRVAQWVRSDVWTTLGFTMSAGISTNKTMAKLAASYGKPNGQAVLHPERFGVVLGETKMKKVRHFGGKLGNSVLSMLTRLRLEDGSQPSATAEELKGTVMMQDLAKISLPTLNQFFSSDTAEFIYHTSRGIDHESVKETSGALVKSITAFKSFPAAKSSSFIQNWLSVLSKEIAERQAMDTARNQRYPRTCTLNYTYYTTPTGIRPPGGGRTRSMMQSRSTRLTFPPEHKSVAEKSASLVEQSMNKVVEVLKVHSLRGVGLSLSNFESRGQPTQGIASIQSFFQKNIEQATGTKEDEGASQSKLQQNTKASSNPSKRPRSGIETFFSAHEAKPSPTVDKDLELARSLQAAYDRENYVLLTSENNTRSRRAAKPPKKKAPKIESFFKRK